MYSMQQNERMPVGYLCRCMSMSVLAAQYAMKFSDLYTMLIHLNAVALICAVSMTQQVPYLEAQVGARMQNSLFNVVNENMTSNDYYTPKWLFDLMGLTFDIDVAAPAQGIPWIPAKRWFSQADDGLAQEWGGGWFG